MNECFFRRLSARRYRPTAYTVGPWGRMQHVGPPAALLVGAVETDLPRPDLRPRRIAVDILGPIPVRDVEVRVERVKPGRTTELSVAELLVDDRPVVRASVWRGAVAETGRVATAGDPLAPPAEAVEIPPPPSWRGGYADAVEWRWLRGSLQDIGPGTAWLRTRFPLVDDEATTHLQALLTLADSANGVGACTSIRSWLYVNLDYALHLVRPPVSRWVGLDAETAVGPDGAGICSSTLHDMAGPIGRCTQSLIVRPRDTPSTPDPVPTIEGANP